MEARVSTDPLADLVLGVAAGSRDDFRELYARTNRFIFARIMELIQDGVEAEDLLQDVYVKIWQSASEFDPHKAKAITWIGAIARHTTINRLRSASFRGNALTQPIENEDEIEDKSETAERGYMNSQRSAAILDHIRTLRPHYRKLIELAYIKGLSYGEISDQMGVPVNTLKTWMRRAIIEIRDGIGGDDL